MGWAHVQGLAAEGVDPSDTGPAAGKRKRADGAVGLDAKLNGLSPPRGLADRLPGPAAPIELSDPEFRREPRRATPNLDRASADQVRGLIDRINRDEGTTFLISTHDETDRDADRRSTPKERSSPAKVEDDARP